MKTVRKFCEPAGFFLTWFCSSCTFVIRFFGLRAQLSEEARGPFPFLRSFAPFLSWRELLVNGVSLHRSLTEKHYSPWVKARQEQLEADVERTWAADAFLKQPGTVQVQIPRKEIN